MLFSGSVNNQHHTNGTTDDQINNNDNKLPVSKTVSTASNRKDKKNAKEKAATNHHTLTLVIAVLVYVVCEIPDKIFRILQAIYFSTEDSENGSPIELRVLGDLNVISNFLLTINSMTNFVVYCLMLKWFRRSLADTVMCRSGKLNNQDSMYNSTTRGNEESSSAVTVSKTVSMSSVNVKM